jgi:hypothetical protein
MTLPGATAHEIGVTRDALVDQTPDRPTRTFRTTPTVIQIRTHRFGFV